VASAGAGLFPLALYVRAVALNESAGGPGLAAAARAWAALSAALAGRTEAAAAAFLETVAGEGAVADFGVGPEIPAAARRILAHHLVPRVGLEALASLPPLRLVTVLEALGQGEAERLLDEFSVAGSGTATIEVGVAAIAEAT